MKPSPLHACLVLALLLGSCQGTRRGAAVQHSGVEVILAPEHQHSRYCGHYRVGQRWYWQKLHKHGVHCGHEPSEDGHGWVLIER